MKMNTFINVMDLVLDFENLESCCRTCLKEVSNERFDIFVETDSTYESVNVLEMLTQCTSIQVNKTDILPKTICRECHYRLTSCYEFRKLAEQVDYQLQKVLEETPNRNAPAEEDIKSLAVTDVKIENENCSEIIANLHEEVKEEVTNDFADTDLILQNFKDEEPKAKIKCEVCNKKFKTLSWLEKHLEKHKNTDIKIFTCNFCTRSFKRHFRYVKHLLTHGKTASEIIHNENEYTEKMKCETCSITFRSLNSLAAHMRKHTKNGRILSCSICGKVFTKLSHMKRHELIHDENRPFKCTVCPKKFNTENLLSEHMTKHVKIKPHICPMCSKAFVHVSALSTHLKVHTREKQYLCPTCGKKFDSSTKLDQHAKRHLGLKNFACIYCPKKFVTKGELQTHNRTHTGEKPWACEQCGAAFSKRGSLAQHKLRHAGLKPHQCDACPMRFVTRDHLRRHARTHSGERPYRCGRCARAFAQSYDLAKHRRTHAEGAYKCTECDANFRLQRELRRHTEHHFKEARERLLHTQTNTDSPHPPTDGTISHSNEH